MPEPIISHRGVITSIDENNYHVSIISESACSACHAKGICSMSEMKEKIIDIPKTGAFEHKTGDFVRITMKKTMGTQAVVFGYFIPFVLLITTLLTVEDLTKDEGIAGLAAIGVLVPYYAGLYLFRNFFKKKFSFTIEDA